MRLNGRTRVDCIGYDDGLINRFQGSTGQQRVLGAPKPGEGCSTAATLTWGQVLVS